MNLYVIKKICFVFMTAITITFSLEAQEQKNASVNFLKTLKQGRIEAAYDLCGPKLQGALTQEQFVKIWEGLRASFGELKTYDLICKEKKNSFKLVFYEMVFSNRSVIFNIVLDRKEMVEGFRIVKNATCSNSYSSPPYNDKTLYSEEKISFQTEYGELFFSLMLPQEKPKIFFVLLPGSGLQDRNESLGPNKIFKDLAIGLAVNGIGSVRYDKPLPKNIEVTDNYTINNEYVVPTLSLTFYLKKHFPESKIYLIGHSLGGMVAPIIAGKNDSISGSVLMAANFRPLGELIIEQVNYLSSLRSNNPVYVKKLNKLKKQVTYLKDSLYSLHAEQNKLPFHQSPTYWRSVKNYEVLKNKKIIKKKPLLVLWGEKDYQVSNKDFKLWKKTFSKNEKNKFISYPALNHLFLPTSIGIKSIPIDYKKGGNVPEQVILDIVLWVKKLEKP